jgi:hypothetical protein
MTPLARTLARLSVVLVVAAILTTQANAALFSDVPVDHPSAEAIETLAQLGIVKGREPGRFDPSATLNRAELLTLLYRATERATDGVAGGCFSDVPDGVWFASVVCAAQRDGLAKGYSDGTFKPGNPVNRAEALTLVARAFGWNITTAPEGVTSSYTDVVEGAWYGPVVLTAISREVLPLPGGLDGPLFDAGKALTRAQAASLIWAGLGWPRASVTLVTSTSSEQATSSSVSSQASEASAASSVSSSLPSREPVTNVQQAVTPPFSTSFTLDGKQTGALTFSLSKTLTLRFTVEGSQGQPTCTLFRFAEDGISNEYYYGVQREGSMCDLRATLPAGSYQFEVRSGGKQMSVEVTSAVEQGDGNDGFSEAVTLRMAGTPARGSLTSDDTGQFYTFRIAQRGSHLVELTAAEGNLACVIFASADVEFESFEQPSCNLSFDYPMGTYTVWVGHDPLAVTRRSFSLSLR